MSGTLGVASIKQLMTTGKLGAISFLQAVSKDGFQGKDFIAPIKSPMFLDSMAKSGQEFVTAVKESAELDFGDKIAIGKHAYDCWKDIAVEGKLAIAKIKAGSKAA